MTELSFLLDLFLNHKLPVATKKAIMERVRDVEARLSQPLWTPPPPAIRVGPAPAPSNVPPHLLGQSPSTIAAMMRNGMANEPMPSATIVAAAEAPPIVQPPEPAPVTVIAQTAAAQAALNDRSAAISAAISGKPEKGRTSPRKF